MTSDEMRGGGVTEAAIGMAAVTGVAGETKFSLGNSTVDNAGALPVVEVVVIGTAVSVIIVGIVVGNAFVVASVAAFREMRTLTNWMIVSLASADLLVAVAVLPLSAYQVCFCFVHRRKQEVQLLQRGCAMLHITEYFAKSFRVTQGRSMDRIRVPVGVP